MDSLNLKTQTESFIDEVYNSTSYGETWEEEAKTVFTYIKQLTSSVMGSTDGKKIVKQYTTLAATISTEGTFNDMIKIIWRMVKEMGGAPQYKLCLFFLGLGTIYSALEKKADSRPIQTWRCRVVKWLGTQLTSGGKGVAGEGEGSVNDRIQRFFSTPYLHDFD